MKKNIAKALLLTLCAVLLLASCDGYTIGSGSLVDNYVWGGTSADTSWYDESKSDFTLKTAAQLAGLAKLVNEDKVDFVGKTIYLGNDIDLNGKEWTPIGMGERRYGKSGSKIDAAPVGAAFAGTFDGKGYTISNFTITYESTETEDNTVSGFFGLVIGTAKASSGTYAVVKNVTFDNATINSDSNTAGVAVGYAEYATISGVTVTNSSVTALQGAATVARLYRGGTIENCSVSTTSVNTTGENSTPGYNAAGIVSCASELEAAEGIVIKGNSIVLTDKDTITAAEGPAGGIAAYVYATEFSNNTVTATSNSISLNTTPADYNQKNAGYLVGNWRTNNATCSGNKCYVDNVDRSSEADFTQVGAIIEIYTDTTT